ncbi:hypothetical protein Pcinc_034891 [Petrolisthes cinctipes]|uniref:DDE Tnp4 domain-containing protein n=1 Tax=Petrolisthes cinctipes TaxID=88211 RepID=A0AAE1BXV4_PETCI|nr:hypothetical protein Pcinc_034891 [Petrolisthes cinctipes]
MVHPLPSRLQRHFGDYLLLGDSGYLLEPFLMTPVTNPTNEAEELYYRALVRTRVIVELTLGVVKNRFRCIHRFGGELQYTPLRSAKIVSACLLLHNRCVSRSIPDPNNHLPEEDMPIEAHESIHCRFSRAVLEEKVNEVLQNISDHTTLFKSLLRPYTSRIRAVGEAHRGNTAY